MSEDIRKIKRKRIVTHKWICKKCDDKLFLRVDENNENDLKRLSMFEQYVTKHVLKTEHEMNHVEKEDRGFRYV